MSNRRRREKKKEKGSIGKGSTERGNESGKCENESGREPMNTSVEVSCEKLKLKSLPFCEAPEYGRSRFQNRFNHTVLCIHEVAQYHHDC